RLRAVRAGMNAIYRVGFLQRVPLRTPYPAIVSYVGGLLGRLPRGTELILDYTGVGRPVADLFVYSGLVPVCCLSPGGPPTAWEGPCVSVPKITLISTLIALLHGGRLKVHRDLPEGAVFAEELRDFRSSYTESGHLRFEARTGRHDDLL